ALEAIEKVAVERLAPVLSVGDRLEAERFLHDDRLLDASILVSAKLFARRFACTDAFAELEQASRTQKAADVIGAKRRAIDRGHCCYRPWISTSEPCISRRMPGRSFRRDVRCRALFVLRSNERASATSCRLDVRTRCSPTITEHRRSTRGRNRTRVLSCKRAKHYGGYATTIAAFGYDDR